MQNLILDSQILSTAMSCARLTDFKFNHHFTSLGGKSESLEMGSIVHTVLEYYHKAIIEHKPRIDAIQIGINAGLEYIKTEVNNTEPKQTAWAIETCIQYFEHYKNDFWVPLEAEVTKGKVLYEDNDIRVLWKAKLDLIVDTNQGIFPLDTKTMKQRRDSLSLNNQFIGQCLVTGTRGVFINKIGFQTTLKPAEKFTRVLISYSADRLMEWQSQILPYWCKEIIKWNEDGYFPPNFTHCENKYGICPFKEVCEVDTGMREDVLKASFVVGEPWDV
jgi:hypothetical protein